MSSHRLDWNRPDNDLARAEAKARAARRPILDLTSSNPTQVDLAYPEDELRAAVAPRGIARYEPDPRGLWSARESVAAAEARRNVAIAPSRLTLTTSTSESYALLFKTTCDPGDAVLVPEPSYPLFEHLARLEGVRPLAYRLVWDGAWHIDMGSVDAALVTAAGRARALVVVNPNNPTGSFLRQDEHARLDALCARHDLALIADEVFADYPTTRAPANRVRCAAQAATAALTHSLGGLSKSCGLPQLKLGWIATGGPPDAIAASQARLELAADTYLSVSTPVQLALPRLFALGHGIRDDIRSRIDGNRRTLLAAVPADAPLTVLPTEGGWSAIVRVPATRTDEGWALALLEEDGVLVQPGYFFDMPDGAWLILSLLTPPATFATGVERLVARVAQDVAAG